MKPAVEEIKEGIQGASAAGFGGLTYFHLLMLGAYHMHFREVFRLEVVRQTRRLDVFTAGGRRVVYLLSSTSS